MRKLMKSVSLIAIVFMLFAVNSCTKDSVMSNENNTVMHKSDPEQYPFVLPEAMQPFQYAIYEDDEYLLFGYIQFRLENIEEGDEDESGYFILSLNADASLMYYGFITETSIYYNPNIWVYPDDPSIDPDSNDGGGMCFSHKRFNNFDSAWAYAKEQAKEGYEVSLRYYKKKGFWDVEVHDGNP